MTTESVDPVEQFFIYSHLPPHLQEISKPFSELKNLLVTLLPNNEQRHVMMQKLLEAKDAAVRARLFK